MNILTMIVQSIGLVGAITGEAQNILALADQIRNLDPDAMVSLRTMTGQTYAINADTRAGVAAWLAKFAPEVPPPAPSV